MIIIIILILAYLYIIILDAEIRSIYSNFRKAIRDIENKLLLIQTSGKDEHLTEMLKYYDIIMSDGSRCRKDDKDE